MAKAKSTGGTTRMVAPNGATVSVATEKVPQRLAAGFTEAKPTSTTKADPSK